LVQSEVIRRGTSCRSRGYSHDGLRKQDDF
jgi:hypothetical protein